MKKILLKIVEKFRSKYPLWLESWFIKKYWLYTQPKSKQLLNQISMDLFVRSTVSTETVMIEILSDLLDTAWQDMAVDMKYGFFPESDSIHVETWDIPQDLRKIIRLKWTTNYKGHTHLRYMQDLMEQLDIKRILS